MLVSTNLSHRIITVIPNGSPKGSYKQSVSEKHHTSKLIDAVILTAVNNQVCSCKVKPGKDSISNKSSSPGDEAYQH